MVDISGEWMWRTGAHTLGAVLRYRDVQVADCEYCCGVWAEGTCGARGGVDACT